jgi:hypothetical protein
MTRTTHMYFRSSILPVVFLSWILSSFQPQARGQTSFSRVGSENRESAKHDRDASNKIPLIIKLPSPPVGSATVAFELNEQTEPVSDRPRALLKVPVGVTKLTPKKMTTSSESALQSDLHQITAQADRPVHLGPGKQWLQLDLGETNLLFAVAFWHAYWPPDVFHDVLAQVSSDERFEKDVLTVFNNDYDNSLGFGRGSDREYTETFEGKLIPLDAVCARYVRLYSSGSRRSPMNSYLRVDVYGIQRKSGSQ